MIKNEKGITLVSLMLTVILMLMLAGVGIRVTFSGIKNVENNQLKAELGIVRQAIIEQYSLAEATNQIKISVTKETVSFWRGKRIENFSEIQLPEESLVKENSEVQEFYRKRNQYDCQYQEDYYYRLNPEMLSQIGIAEAKYTYIVNYKTGEVYNETKQMTSNSNLLYLPSTVYENHSKTEDNTSFNDWNEEK